MERIHRQNLKKIFRYFEQVEEIPCNLLKKEEHDLPHDILMVLITPFDDKDRQWALELSFLPTSPLEDSKNDIDILQCFTAISNQIYPEAVEDLIAMATRINTKLPTGAFGFYKPSHTLYLKHNQILQNDLIDENNQIVSHIRTVFIYQFYHFVDRLLAVGNKTKTPNEAMADHPLKGVFW